MNGFKGLLILVPTRNRASLAAAAIQSVIDANLPNVRVMVSDNSTDPEQIDAVARFCSDSAVDRIRPPTPLPMDAHWEWAVQQGENEQASSHIAILTDRMIFLPGALAALVRLTRRYPREVISYNHDGLSDNIRPVELWQVPWTGRVLQVRSDLLLQMTARYLLGATEPVLPRLLHCVVPKSTLREVRHTFGAICGDSVSPDYAFAFRCLASTSNVVHFDRPVLLSYAADRSNGINSSLGRMNQDHADFLANLDSRGVNFAAPIPGVLGPTNSIIHEYCAVHAGGVHLPPVDWDRYIAALTADAKSMDPGKTKSDLEAALEDRAGATVATRAISRPSALFRRLALAARSPAWIWSRALIASRRVTPIWQLVEARTGNSRPLLSYRVTTFASQEAAVEGARSGPRRPNIGPSVLEVAAQREFPRGSIRKLGILKPGDHGVSNGCTVR